MSKNKLFLSTIFLSFTLFLPLSTVKADDVLFTAHNIWYEAGKEKALWCINYKKGIMIPAGTEVRHVRLTRAAMKKPGPKPPAISFVTVRNGRQFYVNFKKRFHPGKTIHDYMNTMFTRKNFTEQTKGLKTNEIEAIRKGVIVLGMSKRAVVTSYGYPPEHRTASVHDNVWTYWMNRFRSKEFHFDTNGETVYPVPVNNQL